MTTLRFLVGPTDLGNGGKTVQAGRVLEWIDKAGYACAVGWSGHYSVTAYIGNVNFSRPIAAGEVVEVHARMMFTGRTSMHIHVTVRASEINGTQFDLVMDCILVFVAMSGGEPHPVPRWVPSRPVDLRLHQLALQRIEPRRAIQAEMGRQTYTDQGTTPRTVLRFIAAPSDANWGGNVHGGIVMRWIQEAAHACAASWIGVTAEAAYTGGVRFHLPIRIGQLVEVDARILHTSEAAVHLSIHVRSGDLDCPERLELATHCMAIFVAPDESGRPSPVQPLELRTEEDDRLNAHARHLIDLRRQLTTVPVTIVTV
jgi:acyl-CoA hydrolase